MSDNEHNPHPFPVPALRVAATYHGSDGRVPEEIVIEIGGDGPVGLELIDRTVAALANVAVGRASYSFDVTGSAADVTAAAHRSVTANLAGGVR